MGDAFKEQASTLAELPLDKLFGAPFHAASKAQAGMAINTALFISQFGLDASGQVLMTTMSSSYDIPIGSVTDLSGGYLIDPKTNNPGKKRLTFGTDSTKNTVLSSNAKAIYSTPGDTTTLVVGYERQIGQRRYIMNIDGLVLRVQGIRTISVPFITLLNVPSLAMNEVTVDFSISIKTQSTTSVSQFTGPQAMDAVVTDGPVVGGGGWSNGWESVGWVTKQQTVTRGSVATTSESQSSTTTSSTYTVSMKAKQKQPAGMKIILDFITNQKDATPKKSLDSQGQISSQTGMSAFNGVLQGK